MFDQFIEYFRKLHSSQNAIFQLVVCDLSWATMLQFRANKGIF